MWLSYWQSGKVIILWEWVRTLPKRVKIPQVSPPEEMQRLGHEIDPWKVALRMGTRRCSSLCGPVVLNLVCL